MYKEISSINDIDRNHIVLHEIDENNVYINLDYNNELVDKKGWSPKIFKWQPKINTTYKKKERVEKYLDMVKVLCATSQNSVKDAIGTLEKDFMANINSCFNILLSKIITNEEENKIVKLKELKAALDKVNI